MKCNKCNYENIAEAKFCRNCGSILEVVDTINIVENIDMIEMIDIEEIKQPEPELIDFEMPVSRPIVNEQINSFAQSEVSYTQPEVNNSYAQPEVSYTQPIINNSYVQPEVNNSYNQPEVNVIPNPINSFMKESVDVNNSVTYSLAAIFKIIIMFLMRPISTFEEKGNGFTNLKNSAILSSIAGILITISLFITDIINNIKVVKMNFFGPSETEWVFENIKNVNFFSPLLNFGFVILGILAIASIFYVGALVVRKNYNFNKLIALIVLAFMPLIIVTAIMPIIVILPSLVSLVIISIASVYSIVTLINLINNEIKFDNKDHQVYYSAICYGASALLFAFITYYVLIKTVEDTISKF